MTVPEIVVYCVPGEDDQAPLVSDSSPGLTFIALTREPGSLPTPWVGCPLPAVFADVGRDRLRANRRIEAGCSVIAYDLVTLDHRWTIDPGAWGKEIYELLPLA